MKYTIINIFRLISVIITKENHTSNEACAFSKEMATLFKQADVDCRSLPMLVAQYNYSTSRDGYNLTIGDNSKFLLQTTNEYITNSALEMRTVYLVTILIQNHFKDYVRFSKYTLPMETSGIEEDQNDSYKLLWLLILPLVIIIAYIVLK